MTYNRNTSKKNFYRYVTIGFLYLVLFVEFGEASFRLKVVKSFGSLLSDIRFWAVFYTVPFLKSSLVVEAVDWMKLSGLLQQLPRNNTTPDVNDPRYTNVMNQITEVLKQDPPFYDYLQKKALRWMSEGRNRVPGSDSCNLWNEYQEFQRTLTTTTPVPVTLSPVLPTHGAAT